MLDISNIVYLDWILLLMMCITFSQQLFSKKFNIYGILSILSLAIYIAIHSVTSGMSITILLLFISSVTLIIMEMFVPGGILGIVGLFALLYSLVLVNNSTQEILFILVVSSLVSITLFIVNIYIFKRKLLFLDRFILTDDLKSEDGYVAKESDINLIGKELITHTDLRPAGVAIKDNKKYDVVSEGDFIEKGTEVLVVNVEGMRIVVRKK